MLREGQNFRHEFQLGPSGKSSAEDLAITV